MLLALSSPQLTICLHREGNVGALCGEIVLWCSHHTSLYCAAEYHFVSYRCREFLGIARWDFLLHCRVLHCIVMYCIALHCIALYRRVGCLTGLFIPSRHMPCLTSLTSLCTCTAPSFYLLPFSSLILIQGRNQPATRQ